MARKFLKYDTKNRPSNVDAKGCLIGGGGGKKLVFTHEVTNGKLENVEIAMKPLKDLIESDKNFMVEIVYDYYDTLYYVGMSRYSSTMINANNVVGFHGSFTDEWGENRFNCLCYNDDTFTVSAKASGGTFKRFNIYEIA